MGASLKDIACKLNLSKTTVSWVLSGQGDKKGISAETQSRVLACARSLAYEPNLLARSLNTGVSKTIGLILPSISDTFFAHIADRIESEAEREGYSLMIAGSNSETERENALIRLFRSKRSTASSSPRPTLRDARSAALRRAAARSCCSTAASRKRTPAAW